jgi:hypothetical protein
MQDAVVSLRGVDLRTILYPSPGKLAQGQKGLKQLDRFLTELQGLLPSWSNNLSSRYFSHARTLPIAMGQ